MNERLLALLADSFWKILLPGLTVTLPLTAISFFFAMVIALALALVQFANLRMLRQFARFYIWVIRGTPLLVQLFVVFYGLSGVGIVLPPWNQCRRSRWRRGTASACPTFRSSAESCCPRPCAPHFPHCPTP